MVQRRLQARARTIDSLEDDYMEDAQPREHNYDAAAEPAPGAQNAHDDDGEIPPLHYRTHAPLTIRQYRQNADRSRSQYDSPLAPALDFAAHGE